ncbi:MAG: hypothetical protein UT29_C0002G0032 [Candidatus Yanofskybacteria bacterium GW2011_GWA1_39_13]|uniref:Uncharacterized protein n=1 Tax=Yanofskybacteria sp. (strain GW2011_GWA1_39_13) TaxID=1619019 RepID=A0A0G0PWC6_YANXG|nr:MAG: hypothetical protein UT29_C0002G0032 [Candidatus Yanofskybacteria bacterium GW2011_GWA1_39_13]
MNYIKYILISLLFMPVLVFAETQSVLPSAGLTPESSFYFFDRFGETLQRFFTFNPEGKARLEISFAKERIAEIKLILEDKGVTAKGLDVAEAKLQDNLSRATAILIKEKQDGNEIGEIAKELSDEINPAQEELKDAFKSERDALKAKEEELKAKLKEARRVGDTAQITILTKELADIRAERELLDQSDEDNDEAIDQEDEKIDEAMELKEEAEKKIREAEKDKAELLKEAEDKNVVFPATTFNTFDGLISQAKTAFAAGKYEEAKRLAKEAKGNLKEVEKSLEKLKDVKEKNEELKQGSDEQQNELRNNLKEADKENAERILEEIKKNEENLKEEQEKILEEQKKIEEELKSSGEQEND